MISSNNRRQICKPLRLEAFDRESMKIKSEHMFNIEEAAIAYAVSAERMFAD